MVARLVKWLEGLLPERIKGYLPEIANAVGGIFLAFSGLAGLNPWEDGLWKFASSRPGAMFLLGAGLILVGTYASVRRTQTVAPLKAELERFQTMLERMTGLHYELCSTTLARISRETFGYGDTERITVYRHRGGNAFQVMGRHSEDPVFKERGRPVYPADQGVLGHAWRHRRASAELPDPQQERERYYRVLEDDWGIDRKVAEDFTMKSRSLVACALFEPKGIDPVAVVVVESTKVGILDKERIAEVIDVNVTDGGLIYDFLEMMQPLEPDLQYTRERGF
jgi:hypothetical protein